MKNIIFILLFTQQAFSQSYTTNFSATENPISESGKWVNGQTTGIDWHDCETDGSHVHGRQHGVNYTDGTAILTGTWGANQSVMATVYTNNPTTGYYPEVELRVRSTLTANVNSGYEALFSCTSNGSTIVRWNGPVGDYTVLTSQKTANVTNGDSVRMTMTGFLIRVYKNGVMVDSVSDVTFASGSPGIGFNNLGAVEENLKYGFSSFTATAEPQFTARILSRK